MSRKTPATSPPATPTNPAAIPPQPEIVPASEGPVQAAPAPQYVAMDRRAWDAIDAAIANMAYHQAAPIIALIQRTGGVRPVSVSGA